MLAKCADADVFARRRALGAIWNEGTPSQYDYPTKSARRIINRELDGGITAATQKSGSKCGGGTDGAHVVAFGAQRAVFVRSKAVFRLARPALRAKGAACVAIVAAADAPR